MNYNAVISVNDVTDASGSITEPVTLSEMKDYLRLQGFVDTDSSPSTDLSNFDFDDQLIKDMITAARELMEEKLGISIVPHTWEAVITNLCGMIEIPYGPVKTVTSLKDNQGTLITTYTIVGNLWKNLKSPCYKEIVITYTAGFDELPRSIKIDLMRLVQYMYENRGSSEGFISQLSSKYSRNLMIV